MEDLKRLIKLTGPKMIPFIKTVSIYFLLVKNGNLHPLWSTTLKCAPIMCLMAFILLYGVKLTKEFSYPQKIFVGLIFSAFGDIFLNIDMFPHGMAAFGIAQAFYISAFGFKRLRLWLGIVLYAFGLATYVFIKSNIKSSVILIGLPIYASLLLTMCWRALDRAKFWKSSSNLTSIICAIGSILFVFSDATIAIDKFYTPLQYRHVLVMATYYAAQFAITLSIVDLSKKPTDTNADSKKDKKKISGSSNKSPKKVKRRD